MVLGLGLIGGGGGGLVWGGVGGLSCICDGAGGGVAVVTMAAAIVLVVVLVLMLVLALVSFFRMSQFSSLICSSLWQHFAGWNPHFGGMPLAKAIHVENA